MKKIINDLQEKIRRSPRVFIGLLLVMLVWVVFGQTLGNDFINFDDQFYVYENPAVMRGLSLNGVHWAFTHTVSMNWHPLTMLSHMLDCSLYGLNPAGHHLTNVLLHALVAVLLFLALMEMTGAAWRSGFVAAVFAVHPLRAESVAWIAERKDMLSGVFFMLTLLAYLRYARKPFSVSRYAAVLVLLALGLMCKPMLVTMPFVLLLLDYWPLGRFSEDTNSKIRVATAGRLFMEKLPMLALSAMACVGTLLSQQRWIIHQEDLSIPARIGNALLAYVIYLRQMFFPAGLGLMYQHPKEGVSVVGSVSAGLLLVAISACFFLARRERRYLLVGWFWFLGMLVPVIGLVQVGMQAHADRYTYLPEIGLYILVAWFLAELSTGAAYQKLLRGGAVVVVAILVVLGCIQTSYWLDSETIWRRSLAVTGENFVAHSNLGGDLYKKGRIDEAMAEFQKAIDLKPSNPDTYDNYGAALVRVGRTNEAIGCFQKALEMNPDDAVAHNNLGSVFLQQGKVDEAVDHLNSASEMKPGDAEALNALANAFLKKGDTNRAVAIYETAVGFDERNAGIENNLASALLNEGLTDQAIVHFQKVIQLNPDYPEAESSLAFALSKAGKTEDAIGHYQRALMAHADDAEAHFRLANLLLTQGRIGEAIVHYQKTLALNPQQSEAESNLGLALFQTEALVEAGAHLEKAVLYDAKNVKAHNNLAGVLMAQGRTAEAIAHYEKALALQPHYLEAQLGLAWALATAADGAVRNGSRAVELARQANELAANANPLVLRILAAALAESGNFAEAVDTAQRALSMASDQHNKLLVAVLEKELALYRTGSPFHSAPLKK